MGRVVVTGASGLLGRAIFREFKTSSSWEVQGWAFSRGGEGLVKVDITDKDAVTKAIVDFKVSVYSCDFHEKHKQHAICI